MKFIDYPLLVVVWTQEGCPACIEYHPVFVQVASRYQQCVPSVVVRAENYPAAADRYFVRGTPTTMLLRHGRRTMHVIDGAAPPDRLERFFRQALHYAQNCQL